MIEFRQNNDSEVETIAAAIARFETALQAQHPHNLVIDMRMNGGGDMTTTRAFMERLPSLVPGRIFVLTSPWTFSAAIAATGYVKQAAPDRVTIVGEALGDRLVFFAEGRNVELPHSHVVLRYSTERHDFTTGCRPYTDCNAYIARYPLTVESLAPDIEAAWTIDAYAAGHDPEWRLLRRRSIMLLSRGLSHGHDARWSRVYAERPVSWPARLWSFLMLWTAPNRRR
ncbi:MAG: hypothetical protein WDM79_18975 [Terricaulis sp.]